MTNWRPLSKRGHADPAFDELQDGLPDYLLDPIVDWVEGLLWDGLGHPREDRLKAIQVRLHTRLKWSAGGRSAIRSVCERMEGDREFALDVVDLLLDNGGDPYIINSLLEAGGSVWQAADPEGDGNWRLTRRSLGPIVEVIHSIQPASQRAHQHLIRAWSKLAQRDPDPSGSYREAVRAVEAAAKPVVLPDDDLATLGKMFRAIRDKPSKWQFVLGEPTDVARMCELMWTSQLDRHGTDDNSVPLDASIQQADAAVHLAITLVRFFAGELIQPSC